MSAPRENPGPLADGALNEIEMGVHRLRQCLDAMRQRGDGQSPAARAISIAITQAETSVLWIRCALLGGEP